MSGWYPDPTGRFEYRFHNDRAWTADVATAGQRYVDPLPPAPPTAGQPAGGGNGLAVAGMVCGIVGLTLAWIPLLGIAGWIAAVVGLALSIPGLALARRTGARKGAAIAGVVTSSLGIVAGALGIVLTVLLVRAVNRFDDPGRYDAELTECTSLDGEVVARGELVNRSARVRSYTVVVELAGGAVEATAVDDVDPGATADFEVREPGTVDDVEPSDCRIRDVFGPTPFGLDPSMFE